MGDVVIKKDDEYDPHKERHLRKPIKDWEAMLHIVKGILGTGILAMPEAFKHAGIFLGFVVTIVNGLLCAYGILIFVGSLYTLGKRNKLPVVTYSQGMELGFLQGPPWAKKRSSFIRIAADIFLISYQVCACCVYIIFIAVNLKAVIDVYLKEEWSVHIYLILLIIPLILINSVRNLKILVPFSLFANIVTFFTIGAVFYYIFETPLPAFSERPVFQSLTKFPLAFGTTCFAFSAVAVAIAVENQMKTPEHFGGLFGVYNISVVILMVLYLALAFFGFWKFGEETKSSITLNLPPDSILSQMVNLLYALAIYISYTLNAYVPIQIIKENNMDKHLQDSKWKIVWEYLLRVVFVIATILIAASIPLLGLFMSLFGATILSHLVLIFPGILDYCLRHPDGYGHFNMYKWRDIFLIVYGIIGLTTTMSVAVWQICIELHKMYT